MKKLIFLWIFLTAFQAFGQQKPAAVKFDEFSDFPAEKISPLYDRTTRFGEKMKRAVAGRQAAIIFYNQRKGPFPLKAGSDWAQRAADILFQSYEVSKDRIAIIDGGYREYAALEFWIVPKNAELPKPSPAFSKDEVVYCPEINLAGDGFRRDRKEPLNFSLSVRGAAAQNFPVEWNTSAGKIVGGQGTNQIQVDLSETDANRITASAIVKGLPPECDCHAYHSTEVGLYPYLIDQFPFVPYSDLSARLDSFYFYINSEPAMTGYIYIYGSRQGRKRDVALVNRNIRQAMMFMKYDASRLKIIDGGFREEMMVEFYLVPAGIAPPVPTSTLNSDFVVEPSKKPKKRAKAIR